VTGAASGSAGPLPWLGPGGADLYLLDIDDAGLADVSRGQTFGTEVVGAKCNLARPEQITAAVHALLQRWHHLDILVNNAGVSYHGKTDRMLPNDGMRCSGQPARPSQLIANCCPPCSPGDAHIVNVCKHLGSGRDPEVRGLPSSKFGLVGLSESLRAEYASRGLGVTALCPGFVQTKFFQVVDGQNGRTMRTPPKWFFASAEQVAARAVKAIYRNQGVITVSLLAACYGSSTLRAGLVGFRHAGTQEEKS